MTAGPRLLTLVSIALLVACGGDEEEPEAPATIAVAAPTPRRVIEATTTPADPRTATPGIAPPDPAPTRVEDRVLQGAFLEPLETAPDRTVLLGPPPAPAFEAWDRESVVLYDLQLGASTNYGPGYFAGFSGDGARFGFNHQGKLWVVEIATGERTSYEISGGRGSLVGDHYAIAPSANGSLLDLDTGLRTSVEQIDDPELRYLVEQRLRPSGGALLGDGLVLRQADWEAALCADTSEPGKERCRAEALERWTVEDLASGEPLLSFRAVKAAPAGPGELVLATNPRCGRADGSVAWCEDVAAELRATQDRAGNNPVYVQGTMNIFLVDIATGEAEFVATAAYRQHPFSWPLNWPLIASGEYVIWTEAYCAQRQGKTRVFERASGQITELDVSEWVRWHDGFVGFGAFTSHAIVDPRTLEYVAAVPRELSGVQWSEDFRYAAVGSVPGHGGLCY